MSDLAGAAVDLVALICQRLVALFGGPVLASQKGRCVGDRATFIKGLRGLAGTVSSTVDVYGDCVRVMINMSN